jgi:hypothetical protein
MATINKSATRQYKKYLFLPLIPVLCRYCSLMLMYPALKLLLCSLVILLFKADFCLIDKFGVAFVSRKANIYLNIVSVTHISPQLLYSKPFIPDAGSCAQTYKTRD